MWKYFVIGVLLLPGANAQPAKQKTQSQQQSGASQVSPTPLDERQVETGNKANGADNGQQAKDADIAKAFQQTQTRQYWVLFADTDQINQVAADLTCADYAQSGCPPTDFGEEDCVGGLMP